MQISWRRRWGPVGIVALTAMVAGQYHTPVLTHGEWMLVGCVVMTWAVVRE